MSVFKNRQQLEQVMGALFRRILQDQEMREDLASAQLRLRFRYRDPEAVVTVDFTATPPVYQFDDRGDVDVEMIQSADVSHAFWLGQLSVIKAIATGKIMARGNVAKAMKLLPAIKPAFSLYREVLQELHLEHFLPEKEIKLYKRKSKTKRWFRFRKSLDRSYLPVDTLPQAALKEQSPSLFHRNFSLPDDNDARRIAMLQRMLLIRAFEKTISKEWSKGHIPTTAVHLCIGQEAIAVGVCGALHPDDCIATTHRGHGHMLAKGAPPHLMMADIYGKAEGLCKGKGGSMHVTDAAAGAIGANGIVGASALLAAGAALTFQHCKENRVAVAFFGDGAISQGMVHEALNLASVWSLPVLFVVENNGYCGFSPRSRHSRIAKIAGWAATYGMNGRTVDGNDMEAVYAAAKALVDNIRTGKGPALLECITYRWQGHMEGDEQSYRTNEEIEEWKTKCPIRRLTEQLIAEDRLTAEKAERLQRKAQETVADAQRFIVRCSEPNRTSLNQDVYAPDLPLPAILRSEATSAMTGSTAINRALAEEMRRDKSVILLGEDVSTGGYMGVTTGLLDEFGEDRVRNTPISEYAIVGAAVGAAMSGLRPVVEIMFSDFITCAMDPIVNQAAKLRYMSGGQYHVPLVIRLPGGAGLGLAAQHSQSFESLLMGIPGLFIAAPSTPRDCRALLKTAIQSNNPVLFFEHKLLYLAEGKIPNEEEWIPFGKADVKRSGQDMTVVGLLYTVNLLLEAADQLTREGIDLEVIDLRTLSPLDAETVLQSVAKTGRLLTVEEGSLRGGWGAEIVARVAAAAHGLLQAPPVRLGASDNPIPYNRALENASLPQVENIVATVRKLMQK